jgi:hypothetical protein
MRQTMGRLRDVEGGRMRPSRRGRLRCVVDLCSRQLVASAREGGRTHVEKCAMSGVKDPSPARGQ